jgi:hypothetical protein
VPGDDLALGEPAADLDDVGHHALAEGADFFGVCG